MARRSERNRTKEEAPGLWHQPALMNLLADLLSVLAIAGLSWAALLALQRLPAFPLRELVLIEVPVRLTSEQLEHVMRTQVPGNFFTVDLDATRSVFEKLPWVRKARVQRQWPGGLSLVIEEHEARARWRHPDGSQALVNTHGEIFVAELPEAGGPVLPLLSGPAGSAAEILRRHEEFSGMLTAIGRRADRVVLSPRHAWQIRLDDGVTLELGRDQGQHPLSERLARFTAHYPTLKSRMDRLQVADMRYPNGFVVNGTTATPAVAAGRKS
jgi:cell division protein FtsQ